MNIAARAAQSALPTLSTILGALPRAAAAGLCLVLAACVSKPPPPPPLAQKPEPFKMYNWNGDLAAKSQGAVSIVIYLDKQKAHFFKGSDEVGWTYVATGRSSHPTPSGSFRITEKTANKVSNLYGKLLNAEGDVVDGDFNTSNESVPEGHQFSPARMPLFMRLTNDGVGMHVGPIPRPGRTASHGCIRLPRFMAEKFFANVSIGTPVTIHATSPPEGVQPPMAEKKPWTLFGSRT